MLTSQIPVETWDNALLISLVTVAISTTTVLVKMATMKVLILMTSKLVDVSLI